MEREYEKKLKIITGKTFKEVEKKLADFTKEVEVVEIKQYNATMAFVFYKDEKEIKLW